MHYRKQSGQIDLSAFWASFVTYFLLLQFFCYIILLFTFNFYLVSHSGKTPTNLILIDYNVCKTNLYEILLTPS